MQQMVHKLLVGALFATLARRMQHDADHGLGRAGRRPQRGRRTFGAATSGTTTGGVTGTADAGSQAQSAARSEQHPVQAQRLFRFRQLRGQGRVQAADRSARPLPAGRPQRAHDDPGQHRRARQPRVQHRARPAPRRRGEADDGAAGRDRSADRDGELRQGKAAQPGPRRERRGPRIAATTSSIAANSAWRAAAAPAALALPARRCSWRPRRRGRRCSTTTRRASASSRCAVRVDQIERSLDAAPRRARDARTRAWSICSRTSSRSRPTSPSCAGSTKC